MTANIERSESFNMATKTTGFEWKRFYDDKAAWPIGSYHEEEIITVNGLEVDEYSFDPIKVRDSDKITVSGGTWFKDQDCHGADTLEGHFKKWRKSQNTEVLSVEVPKDKAHELRKLITKAGGKIV